MKPDVTVIVPVRGRSQMLERLLSSVNVGRHYANSTIEIIVSHNGADPERAVIEAICADQGATFMHTEGGIAEARNAAAQVSRAQVLFFVDSDCFVEKQTIAAHLDAHRHGARAVAGPTEFVGEARLVWRMAACAPFASVFSWPKRMPQMMWAPSCNLSIDRGLFTEVGGFRRMGMLGQAGEDVDLGVRLNAVNVPVICAPEAIVCHNRETWSSFGAMFLRAARYGAGEVDLVAAHPDNTFLEFPTRTLQWALAIGTSALVYPSSQSVALAVALGLTVVVAVLDSGMAAIATARSADALATRQRAVGERVGAALMNVPFGLGFTLASIAHRPSALWTRFCYGDGQLLGQWSRRVIASWPVVLVILSLLLLGAR